MDDVVSVGPWYVDPAQLLEMRRNTLRERFEADEWAEAVIEAEELLETAPDDLPTLRFLAEALLRLGEPDIARLTYEQRLKLGANDVDTLVGHGLACYEVCDAPMALESLREAIRLQPKHAEGHFSLALVLELLGRDDEAEVHFSRARVLDPDTWGAPLRLTAAEWSDAVREALDQLPPDLADVFDDVPVQLEPLPSLDELRAHQPPLPPSVAALLDGDPGDDEEPEPPKALRVFTRTLSRQPSFDHVVGALTHAFAIEAAEWLGVDLDDLDDSDDGSP